MVEYARWSGWTKWVVAGAFCSALSATIEAGNAGGLTVSACGDVMIQNVDGGKRLGDDSLANFMMAAKPWFSGSDVGFVNLEGPMGGREPKGCSSENCYRFQQSSSTASVLMGLGVGAVSLANNHANDMGLSGQSDTRKILDAAGVKYAGHFSAPMAWWEKNGLRVGLIALTANGFAPDFRKPEAIEAIRAAKSRSDVLIVSVHMGCEGESCARLKGGREVFLGEDRGDPMAFSKAAIDAGADLVLGSGPHVPRGLDMHKGRLIAYSLGNCAVGPGISTAGKAGLAPVLWARLGKDGALRGWDVGSFKGNGQRLEWDAKEQALGWMLEATGLDSGPQRRIELEALREVQRGLRP